MTKNNLSTYYKPVSADDGSHKTKNGAEEEEEEVNTMCGIGSWRPEWMQCFASPIFFLINFSLIGIVQGMSGSYLIASISTLEKRYAFESKITGFILIADNFSQMLVSPIIGYFGSRYNRPRMIAIGELILAASCFTTALPYFLYGPGTHLLRDDADAHIPIAKLAKNLTRFEMCPANLTSYDCTSGKHNTIWTAVVLFWMGSFLRGLGFTAYFTIGMPYLDDSVSKRRSPLYISLISSLRLLGPVGGYILSGISLRYYENPFYDPGITSKDPRWIGAWWMGYIIIGTLLAIAALPMFLFPKQFKNAHVKAKDLKENVKGRKGTIQAIKRLATNPILMFQLVGNTIRYIGLGGYHIFKPKYIESQYRQSSSGASFITGSTMILPMAVGIMLGGVIITLCKPRPKGLVIYMFIVELFSNTGMFTAMFLGCPPLIMPETNTLSDGGFTLNAACNSDCSCTTRIYTPICSPNNKTYFSPCFAGCQNIDRITNTLSQCSCTQEFGGSAKVGFCDNERTNCESNKLFTYLLVLTLGALISSTARTGNYLLTLRSVEPKDKSFAMGMMSTFMAIFAFIPYPLIYGAIVDSTCLVWEKSCGKRGNCWQYDQDKFRHYLHGASFTFMMIGSMFDIGIICMSSRIKSFYDEEEDEKKGEKEGDTKGDDEINKNEIFMNSIALETKPNSDNNGIVDSNTDTEKSIANT